MMRELVRQDVHRIVVRPLYVFMVGAAALYAVYVLFSVVLTAGYGMVTEEWAVRLGSVMRAGGQMGAAEMIGIPGTQFPATALMVAALWDTKLMWITLPAACIPPLAQDMRSGYVDVRANWGCAWWVQVGASLMAATLATFAALAVVVIVVGTVSCIVSLDAFGQEHLDLLRAALAADPEHPREPYELVFDMRYARDFILPLMSSLLAVYLGFLVSSFTRSLPMGIAVSVVGSLLEWMPFFTWGPVALPDELWLSWALPLTFSLLMAGGGVVLRAILQPRGGA